MKCEDIFSLKNNNNDNNNNKKQKLECHLIMMMMICCSCDWGFKGYHKFSSAFTHTW